MILLTFLKIIGKILLVILAIIFILLLLVLFYPIGYRAKGIIKEDNVDAKLQINWLFHLLGAYLDYREQELTAFYRILFWKKPFIKEDSDEPVETDAFLKDDDGVEEEIAEESDIDSLEQTVSDVSLYVTSIEDSSEEMSNEELVYENDTEECSIDQNNKEKFIENNEDTHNKRDNSENKSARKRATKNLRGAKRKLGKKTSLSQNIVVFRKKLREKKEHLLSKVKEAGKLKDKATGFINDSHNQKAIKHLKKELFYLLKIACPKKLKLKLCFSVGDPAYTGILLGVLAMFPIGYQKKWEITPDFESEKVYADGEFDIRGKIFVYKILFIVIRLILDKECRRMYNKYMK